MQTRPAMHLIDHVTLITSLQLTAMHSMTTMFGADNSSCFSTTHVCPSLMLVDCNHKVQHKVKMDTRQDRLL